MNPQALQLEELRQEVEDLDQWIQEHTDYIEHGLPSPRQSSKVVKTREQCEQAKLRLRSAIDATRMENPGAFTEWIEYHEGILQRMLAEPDRNSATVLIIARMVLKQWEEVVAGKREYVFIGQYVFNDYYNQVRNLFPGNTSTSKSPNKSWWQFWK